MVTSERLIFTAQYPFRFIFQILESVLLPLPEFFLFFILCALFLKIINSFSSGSLTPWWKGKLVLKFVGAEKKICFFESGLFPLVIYAVFAQ